jgi:DNA-binding NarL/FixJ family response regulator
MLYAGTMDRAHVRKSNHNSNRLTPRQIETLKWACKDFSNKQIAVQMGITVKTVEKHREIVSKRTDTHSPIALYRWAMMHGVVEPPQRVDK